MLGLQPTQDPAADEGDGGAIYVAVQSALEPVAHMETQWSPQELVKRVCKYVQNGVKNVNFQNGNWQESVDTYCDNLFATLCKALYDRSYVSEVNWTIVVSAAIPELFPNFAQANIPQQLFDAHVSSSAERAFEDGRFWYATDFGAAMPNNKTKKNKIYEALDAGRKAAWDTARTSATEYLQTWISGTVSSLQNSEPSGNPGNVLPEPAAARLFACVAEKGGLPKTGDIGQEAPREEWSSIVLPSVKELYAAFDPVPDWGSDEYGGSDAPKKKKSKAWQGDEDWSSGSGGGGGWGGGGGGGWGKGGKDMMGGKGGMDMMNMMQGMMSQMQAMMGAKGGMDMMGGKGGKGGKGYDPYGGKGGKGGKGYDPYGGKGGWW